MTCIHCSDTGSLSKQVTGDIDCIYCDAPYERGDLETWYKTVAKPQQLGELDLLWLTVLRERQINQGEKK